MTIHKQSNVTVDASVIATLYSDICQALAGGPAASITSKITRNTMPIPYALGLTTKRGNSVPTMALMNIAAISICCLSLYDGTIPEYDGFLDTTHLTFSM
jgi:hypothetical protein